MTLSLVAQDRDQAGSAIKGVIAERRCDEAIQ